MDFDLKKEEDVKEYLEKLGVEYRFSCFSENRPDGCHLLGDYLETVHKDYAKAAKVYKNNCDEHKYPRSCLKYANACFLGKGTRQCVEDAMLYYDMGCAAGEADACMNGGLVLVANHAQSKQAPKTDKEDPIAKGLDLLKKSCEKNSEYGCYYLSGLFIQGIQDKLTPDMKQAFYYSQKACELGNIYACGNLSQMYRKGDGVEKDEKQAAIFKEKTMDMQRQYSESIEFQQGI